MESNKGGAPPDEDQCSLALGRTTIGGAAVLLIGAVVSVIAVPTINITIVAITLLVFGAIYMGLGVGAYKLAKRQQMDREGGSGQGTYSG